MDDEFDILRFYHSEVPISYIMPQYEAASWTDTLSWCDNSVHSDYNEGFKSGYEDGLSDGFNGRTYGYSYDNGSTFFIYKFYAAKDFSSKMATIRINRKNVSQIFDWYGETYYMPGFSAIPFYKLEKIGDSLNEEIFGDDVEFCCDDEIENFENEEFATEYTEDKTISLDADYDDYQVLGYDNGYEEGFCYGHQRYLAIINDEL